MASLSAVESILDPNTARLLYERLGGTRVYIPAIPAPTSRLVLAIGHAPAARLCNQLAGESVCLPSRLSASRSDRKRAIQWDLARGLSASECALRHGVTTRCVQKIARS